MRLKPPHPGHDRVDHGAGLRHIGWLALAITAMLTLDE
jgi:hypothetical protein